MAADFPDLVALLADARRSAADPRLIWCEPSDRFETTVTKQRGLLLGGAWSPHFLRATADAWSVPFTAALPAPRVLLIDKAAGPPADWEELFASVAEIRNSLLVVARSIEPEVLRALIGAVLKGTLNCCAVRADKDWPGRLPVLVEAFGDPCDRPPRKAVRLPLAAQAWARRSATVVLAGRHQDWPAGSLDVAVVAVGGDDLDDQQARLRFVADELRKGDRGS